MRQITFGLISNKNNSKRSRPTVDLFSQIIAEDNVLVTSEVSVVN